MTKTNSFINKADKFWVYSGLFGLSLFLHYLTPYYQYQPEPDFVYSVIQAPLFEELIYRFLGILVAFYCSKSIKKSESISKKIGWGMFFFVSVICEIGFSLGRIKNILTIDPTFLIIIVISIFLVVLFVFKEYQLEIIILTSSFNFAFVHELFRFFPVFIAGIFFSLLCVNRSRITLIDDQSKKVVAFLLVYGVLPGYLIHLWNNFLNWFLYQQLNPVFIDLLSLLGVIFFLFLLERFVNQFIDQKYIY